MIEKILAGKNILVVEDNIVNQLVIKHILAKADAFFDLAVNGAEAIQKVQANAYDLILMDIQMPGIDGYEATSFIRTQLQINTPVIAMTAFLLNEDDEQLVESGINSYLCKPFTLEALYKAVNKLRIPDIVVAENTNILVGKNVIVDMSIVYDVAGNDDAYVNKMIQTFISSLTDTLTKMHDFLQSQDWDNLYKSAHHAKSSLSIIKIDDVMEWIVDIEYKAKHKTGLSSLDRQLKQVENKFLLAAQLLNEKFCLLV